MSGSLLLFAQCLALLCALACSLPTGDSEAESLDSRIVGGYITNVALHPHQISLRRKSLAVPYNAFSHICGGSIIASDKVVTAAHCIIASVPSQYKVVAGTNFRQDTDGVIVNVQEIIMHEGYNSSSYENDVALLILSPPLPLNNHTIKAIELTETEAVAGTICTITGWGTTSSGGSASNELRAVDVPIVSNDECNDDYGSDKIKPSMMCAGVRGVGGKDSCQGDSGGPLIVSNKLYGIVSWGNACAHPNYPGVYANVANLLTWIKSKVQLP
ncbi:trypsin zeta [Scaptodrosophila lebanonensis]|uniref:trypsin n=1 Tax=Drosophila lebanonensis TaxID=7225 RepID=A0A6J2UH56_DROLE|nr:trypsin zeta [Scaptodrosophila lebanonensis]